MISFHAPEAVRAAARRASEPTPGSSARRNFTAAWRGPHEFWSGLSGVRQATAAWRPLNGIRISLGFHGRLPRDCGAALFPLAGWRHFGAALFSSFLQGGATKGRRPVSETGRR